MNNKPLDTDIHKEKVSAEPIEDSVQVVSIPVDLDDPHRGALEDNPERAEGYRGDSSSLLGRANLCC